MENELDIEDVLESLTTQEAKKKVNSGKKGNRHARNLCKILSERFGASFERTVGSGNRWSQVKELSNSSKSVLVGDIVCPDGFKWVIECKSGYENKVDFHSLFIKGNKTIDDFLIQVSKDAERCSRKPLLAYKRNQKPWLVFLKSDECNNDIKSDYILAYREWIVISLEALLKAPNSFFINISTNEN